MKIDKETREYLEKQLRIRQFMNRWVSTPCLFVCFYMMFAQPHLLWLLLVLMNGFAVLTNWAVGSRIERILDGDTTSTADAERKKKIDQLYGRDTE
jgi:hypothetical protein